MGSSLNDAYIKVEEEKTLVEEKLHNLIYSNYKILLSNFEEQKEIDNELNLISDYSFQSSKLVNDCNEALRNFAKEGNLINAKHKNVKEALLKYPKLIEILEIPQLMDTCLKNGLYEASLQLYEFVKNMVTTHPKIDILKLISKDIEESFQSVLNELIQQLESDASQLPELILTIGLIRSVGLYSEEDMRKLFLKSKSRNLRSALRNMLNKSFDQSIKKEDAIEINYIFFNKLCDIFRIHLFESITQYTALFSLTNSYDSKQSPEDLEFMDNDPEYISRKDLYNRIFHSWLSFEVKNMLAVVDHYLAILFDPSYQSDAFFDTEYTLAFKSISEQNAYIGSSLARVDTDISSLLNTRLLKYSIVYVASTYDRVFERFKVNLYQRSNYFCQYTTDQPKKTAQIKSVEQDKTTNLNKLQDEKNPSQISTIGHSTTNGNFIEENGSLKSNDINDGETIECKNREIVVSDSENLPTENDDNLTLEYEVSKEDVKNGENKENSLTIDLDEIKYNNGEVKTQSKKYPDLSIYSTNQIHDMDSAIENIPLFSALKLDFQRCFENATLANLTSSSDPSDVDEKASANSLKPKAHNRRELGIHTRAVGLTYPTSHDKTIHVSAACGQELVKFYKEAKSSKIASLIPLEEIFKIYTVSFVPHICRLFATMYPKYYLEGLLGITSLKPSNLIDGYEQILNKVKLELPYINFED